MKQSRIITLKWRSPGNRCLSRTSDRTEWLKSHKICPFFTAFSASSVTPSVHPLDLYCSSPPPPSSRRALHLTNPENNTESPFNNNQTSSTFATKTCLISKHPLTGEKKNQNTKISTDIVLKNPELCLLSSFCRHNFNDLRLHRLNISHNITSFKDSFSLSSSRQSLHVHDEPKVEK